MKKAVLLITLALSSVMVFAQRIDKNELKQLKNFLSQPAEKDATNAQALKITDLNAPATWEGVTIEGGHVTEIKWKDKKIAGVLDLSGFDNLRSVDVSRNKITSLSVAGDQMLTQLNASRNRLSEVNLDNCIALEKVSLNNNRITDIEIANTLPTTV